MSYDAVIIGGRPQRPHLRLLSAKKGLKVAVLEAQGKLAARR